jgi:hypothetical protein
MQKRTTYTKCMNACVEPQPEGEYDEKLCQSKCLKTCLQTDPVDEQCYVDYIYPISGWNVRYSRFNAIGDEIPPKAGDGYHSCR